MNTIQTMLRKHRKLLAGALISVVGAFGVGFTNQAGKDFFDWVFSRQADRGEVKAEYRWVLARDSVRTVVGDCSETYRDHAACGPENEKTWVAEYPNSRTEWKPLDDEDVGGGLGSQVTMSGDGMTLTWKGGKGCGQDEYVWRSVSVWRCTRIE